MSHRSETEDTTIADPSSQWSRPDQTASVASERSPRQPLLRRGLAGYGARYLAGPRSGDPGMAAADTSRWRHDEPNLLPRAFALHLGSDGADDRVRLPPRIPSEPIYWSSELPGSSDRYYEPAQRSPAGPCGGSRHAWVRGLATALNAALLLVVMRCSSSPGFPTHRVDPDGAAIPPFAMPRGLVHSRTSQMGAPRVRVGGGRRYASFTSSTGPQFATDSRPVTPPAAPAADLYDCSGLASVDDVAELDSALGNVKSPRVGLGAI